MLSVFASALLLSISIRGEAAQDLVADPIDLRAAFVFNFLKYVEWPSSGLDAYHVVVLGESPILEPLGKIAGGRKIHGRRLVVSRVERFDQIEDCHLLYLPTASTDELVSLLPTAVQRNILVVTEGEGFAARGAALSFVTEGSRVRFEANVETFARAGLEVSSHLLRIATLVTGGP